MRYILPILFVLSTALFGQNSSARNAFVDSLFQRDNAGNWVNINLTPATDTTALKLITASANEGARVFLGGLTSTSNRGAGWFVHADSAYPEGGIAFDSPTAGKQWVRSEVLENPGTYRMEWFGAIKNDSSKTSINRTAWDNLWSALRVNGGGTVEHSKTDTFFLGDASFLDTLWSNTTIRGGVYSIERVGGFLWSPEDYISSNVILEDLVILADEPDSTQGQSSAVLNFVADSNVVLRNVQIYSMNRQVVFTDSGSGLLTDGCTFGPTKRGYGVTSIGIGYGVKKWKIVNSTFLPAKRAWTNQNPINTNSPDGTIANNRINIYHDPALDQKGNTGILAEFESAVFGDSGLVVIGNQIDAEAVRDSAGVTNFFVKGIQVSSAENSLISNNTIRGIRTSNDQRNIGINLGNEDGRLHNVVVRDNIIVDFVVGVAVNTSNTQTTTWNLGNIAILENEIYHADSLAIDLNLTLSTGNITTQFDSIATVLVRGNDTYHSGPISVETDQTSANPWRTHLVVKDNAQYDTSGVFIQLVGTKYWYVTLKNNDPGPLGQAYTYQTFVDAIDSTISTKYADIGPLVAFRSRVFDVAATEIEYDWIDFDAGFMPIRAVLTVLDTTTGDSTGWDIRYYNEALSSSDAMNARATPVTSNPGTFTWYSIDTLLVGVSGANRLNMQNGTFSKMRIQNLARTDANNTDGTGKFTVTVYAILNTKGSK